MLLTRLGAVIVSERMKTLAQHIVGGFKSGVIVGVITGIAERIFLLGICCLSSSMGSEEQLYVGDLYMSDILVTVMTDGYSGIVGGLILGFFLGLFYSIRGYHPSQTNIDIMYFALLCAIFIFGVIEVKIVLYWLPSGIKTGSGVLWVYTLVLFFVSYMLFRIIRWTLHSIFVARLSFMLLYRWAFVINLAILVMFSIIMAYSHNYINWMRQ